ncbi:hypothetical protein AB0M83_26765 [Amycolatopsis sp. NPDC051106]|uniref:hypothetical protein n=1 Tax=unclassified Amycolatopsis TaxID=2618356 RepID=UPI00343575A0
MRGDDLAGLDRGGSDDVEVAGVAREVVAGSFDLQRDGDPLPTARKALDVEVGG